MKRHARLPAKSCATPDRPPTWALLASHLEYVHEAALAVLATTGDSQLEAVGLAPSQWRLQLANVVRLGAIAHDLGKANDHFQDMLRRRRLGAQGLRHEWVTLVVLEDTNVQRWLRGILDFACEWSLVLWAVTGHHPSHDRPSPPGEAPSGSGNSEMRLLLGHADFSECLSCIAAKFDLRTPPELCDSTISLVRTAPDNAFTRITRAFRESHRTWTRLNSEQRRFAAACKACLIAVDVAGSALPREHSRMTDGARWIAQSLNNRPTAEQLLSLAEERLSGKQVRPFQKAVASASGRCVSAVPRAITGQWFCYSTKSAVPSSIRMPGMN